MAKKKCEATVDVVESVENELFKNVRAILAKARAAVYAAANTAMVEAYWNVGREIVEKQGGASRAKYGEGLINALVIYIIIVPNNSNFGCKTLVNDVLSCLNEVAGHFFCSFDLIVLHNDVLAP